MTLLDPNRATIIRTHDRMMFKKCRVRWDYESPNRHNYTTVRPSIPLAFGTAIHAGLEYYYKPELANDPRMLVEAEAVAIFVERFVAEMDGQYPDEVMYEHRDLGIAMLKHYFKHYAAERDEWDFVKTEIPFSVPIPLERVGMKAYDNVTFLYGDDGKPYLAELINVPGLGSVPQMVMYEGQLDIVPIRKSSGGMWVWDHKSTERLNEDGLEWLYLDDQVNAYYWVSYVVLGLNVEGILFNYLKKKMPPEPPKLLKNGKSLSKDHSMSTTVELYKAEIAKHGFDPTQYAEFLAAYIEPTYFHRELVVKRSADLAQIENNIVRESRAIVGVGDDIYPTPNLLNCSGCPFQFPCKMRQRGEDDIQWIESSGLFKRNESYGKPVDNENIPA